MIHEVKRQADEILETVENDMTDNLASSKQLMREACEEITVIHSLISAIDARRALASAKVQDAGRAMKRAENQGLQAAETIDPVIRGSGNLLVAGIPDDLRITAIEAGSQEFINGAMTHLAAIITKLDAVQNDLDVAEGCLDNGEEHVDDSLGMVRNGVTEMRKAIDQI